MLQGILHPDIDRDLRTQEARQAAAARAQAYQQNTRQPVRSHPRTMGQRRSAAVVCSYPQILDLRALSLSVLLW